MVHEIRLVLRSMASHQGFALAALLTLALGIGANTAIFSAIYGVLLRPLPFPDADRIVQLSERVPGGTPVLPGATWISNLTIGAWEKNGRTIGPIATFSTGSATVGLDMPRRVPRGNASPAFFAVLGVQPIAGRFFTREDALQGAAPVVVLSHEIWRERFGGDPTVIGRTISIDDRAHEIIGIAPPGLNLPERETRLWTPAIVATAGINTGESRVEGTRALARLAPDATPAQAAAEGTALARGIKRPMAFDMLFGKGGPVEVHARTLADQMTVRVRPALLVLVAGVVVLLLIACANVANLFLSRGVSRERELAVRVALGASRARLIRELLLESVVISVTGGALGTMLAWALVRALPAAVPDDFPRIDAVRLDWLALAFAFSVSILAGALSGLVPALRGARPDLLPALREAVGASSSRRTTLVRRALLVAEASLAVTLLIAAALLGRSFVQLMRTDPGYDASNVLTARIYLPGASRGQAQTDAFVAELLTRVRALAGVLSAGASNMAPLGRSSFVSGFTVPVPGREAVTARALSYVVTPGYIETLRLRLRAGRLLDERDLASGLQPVIVSEEFVKTFLAGIEPIGVRFPGVLIQGDRMAEIVGVVGNVFKDSLDQQPQSELYVLAVNGATIRREINLVLRSARNPLDHANDVNRIVRELRSDAAVEGVELLTAQVADSVAQPRFAASVLVSFAAVALLLAAIGLYGVLSYTVARRQREIGIRSALGATRAQLVIMVVREGMMVAMLGLAIGLAAAAASTRLMQTLLYGVTPLDAISFLVAPAALVVVALVACALPARRAAATDPVIALRYE